MTATPAPSPVGAEISSSGAFVRQAYSIRDRITADGSSGFRAEPGRYHLYVSLACPWAHRAVIVRRLLGLEDVVTMSVVDPVRDERGWAFREGPGSSADPVNGFQFLSEAYLVTDPAYTGRYTVPCIWDRQTGRLVTNNYPDITIDFETQFAAFHRPGAPDLYPEALRHEIDAVNELVYADVNNGVYRAGFATSQAAYDEAVAALFARLDWLEERLAARRFLVGDQVTEADVRLFTTLVRFDAVYAIHFKCSLRRLVDYPNLWAYARDLYQRPGFGETVNMDHIKRHYYMTHPQINPSRIVPQGPLADWGAPHGRERLGDALTLREAREDERQAIDALTLAAYGEYATVMRPSAWAALHEVLLASLSSQEPVTRIVAELDGALVGSVALYSPGVDAYAGRAASASHPEIRLLAVAPAARGRGVGAALLAECVRRAAESGAEAVGLHSSESMRAAIRMYRRMGFARAPEGDFQPPGAELVMAFRRPLGAERA